MTEYPAFNIVGEEWNYDISRVAYWQQGNQNQDGYESGLPSMMDFPLQKAIGEALDENNDDDDGMLDLYRCLAQDFLYPNPQNLVVFADNHDMDRFFARIGEDLNSWKMGMAYLTVTRGIPQIFYGTEILMSNGANGEHGVIRSDFPGGWQGDLVNGFNGTGLSSEQLEAQDFLRNLLNWRKESKTIHTGELMHFVPDGPKGVYSLIRYDKESIILLMMNPKDKAAAVSTDRFSEIIGEPKKGNDVISDSEFDLSTGIIKIPARQVILLEIER
jgi:glycosidase